MGEKAEASDESFFLESAVIRPVFGMKERSTRTQKVWTHSEIILQKFSSRSCLAVFLKACDWTYCTYIYSRWCACGWVQWSILPILPPRDYL